MAITVLAIESFRQFASGSYEWVKRGWSGYLTTYQAAELNNRYYFRPAAGLYLPASSQRIRLFHRVYPTAPDQRAFLYFREGSNVHISLRSETTGKLSALRGTGTLLDTSASACLNWATWNHIEVDLWIADWPNGFLHIWVNGNAVLSLTGIDTQNSATAVVDNINFPWAWYVADLVVLGDTSNGAWSGPTGQLAVYGDFPDANGTHTDFTPSAGAIYQTVDDQHDGDTTYSESGTLNHKMSVAFPDLPSGAQPKVVSMNVVLRKTDVGARQAAVGLISGATESEDSAADLVDTYALKQVHRLDDPNAGPGWTRSAAQAAEALVKVAS